jgi:hypothetical protein
LEFSGSFKFPGTSRFFLTDHTGKVIPESEDTLRTIWSDVLPDHLDISVQTYLCALNIAFTGALRATANLWYVGTKENRYSKYYMTSIDDAIEYLRQNKLYPVENLDWKKAVRWVFAQGGVFDGYSNTPAAGALNYFTRLFVSGFREDELSNTMWALAGIEALLVEGGRSSSGQLREKLGAILGSAENLAWMLKMTGTLYEFRSQKVHGNRRIRSAFRKRDEEQIDKRFNEEYDSERFAVGVLTILLQHAIQSGRSTYRFKTILDEHQP